MRQLSSSNIIKYLTIILSMAVIAKAISMVLLYKLPKSGVEASRNSANLVAYKGYKIASNFGLVQRKKVEQKAPPKETLKIDSLVLMALYGEGERGFIVFAEVNNPNDSKILSINQEYKGYKLTHIELMSAILEKGGKAYELVFKEAPNSVPLQKRVSAPPPKIENLGDTNVLRAVKKKDVMYYAKNFDAIWKNIAIKEVVKNGKIDGFKVLSVKQNSIFAQLGLLAGDTIMAVNNKPLKSYADAFNIYNNIKDYESLKIDIIRKNEKRELEYEVF